MAALCLLTLLSPLVARAASIGQASTVSPVTKGLPGTWEHVACYVDDANWHVHENENDDPAMTVQSCIAHCNASGFTLAAVGHSMQCCESRPNRLLFVFAICSSIDCPSFQSAVMTW